MPEILGRLRTPRLAAAPSAPVQGEMYFDTALGKLYYWDGAAWVASSGGSGAVYEQPSQPTEPVPAGSIWIDTDETVPWWTYDTDQIGTIKAFAGTTIPTNWMLADGRSLARSAYPELADAMGISAGATNFNIPDLRSRFIYGASAPGVGATGGAATHQLSVAEMPSHRHQFLGSAGAGGQVAYAQATVTQTYLDVGNPANPIIQNSGGDGAHNNLPPFIYIAFIIKVTGPQISAGGILQGAQGPPGTAVIVGALARRLTNFTMQNSAWHVLPFDGEDFDTNGFHDLSTSTNRLTCKVTGKYAWAVWLNFSVGGFTAGAGFFAWNVNKNSEAAAGYPTQQGGAFVPMIGGIGPTMQSSGIVDLTAPSDYISLILYQNGTGTCTLNIGSYFAMWRIG